MKTRVVNLRTENYDVYIGRSTKGNGVFGNPFVMRFESDRDDVIERYRKHFAERVESDPEFRERVIALRGKALGCFCKPAACHGDVIADWVNKYWENRP